MRKIAVVIFALLMCGSAALSQEQQTAANISAQIDTSRLEPPGFMPNLKGLKSLSVVVFISDPEPKSFDLSVLQKAIDLEDEVKQQLVRIGFEIKPRLERPILHISVLPITKANTDAVSIQTTLIENASLARRTAETTDVISWTTQKVFKKQEFEQLSLSMIVQLELGRFLALWKKVNPPIIGYTKE